MNSAVPFFAEGELAWLERHGESGPVGWRSQQSSNLGGAS